MMGVVYNKFLAWAEQNNKLVTLLNQIQLFTEFLKEVYQIQDQTGEAIISLVSTFVAPTVEMGSSKDLVQSLACSAHTSTRSRREAQTAGAD